MTELYRKVRPKKVEDLVGQPEAVGLLNNWKKRRDVPHAIMLYGPSGCGKTTVARIIKRKVGCAGPPDYQEINAATETGISMVRRMDEVLGKVPMRGDSRVWVLDEAHKLTAAAQDGMLKILEEAPRHAYLVLCTTDPQKLIRTIHTRCTKVKLEAIPDADLKSLVAATWAKAGPRTPNEEVVDAIVQASDGSARQSLVILDQVRKKKKVEDMLGSVVSTEHKKQAIDLARAIMRPKPNWKEVVPIIKNLTDDAEGTRRLVLGYVNSVITGGGPLTDRAVAVYEVFRDMFVNGKVDLTAACYAVSRGS